MSSIGLVSANDDLLDFKIKMLSVYAHIQFTLATRHGFITEITKNLFLLPVTLSFIKPVITTFIFG